MKNHFIIFISLWLCFSLQAQQKKINYYYYQGKKIYLTEKTDIIFVKLFNDTDTKSLVALLRSDESLKQNILDEDNINLHLILEAKEGTGFASESLLKYRENPSVKSAHLMLVYENNLLVGLMDEFLLKLKPTTQFLQLQNLMSENGCEVARANPFVENQFVIAVSKTSNLNAMQMANLFYETELFEFSTPNFAILNALNSNDPYFKYQWALENKTHKPVDIKIEQAWNITPGNPSTRIALLDLGVDLNHPDLTSNLFLPGHDETGYNTGGAPYTVWDNHGTACAGIICAVKDNEIGIAGVAPCCKLIPVKIFFNVDNYTFSISEWIANGIRWAYLNGASVISNSWSSTNDDDITNAINEAVTDGRSGKGCVILFSSGNTNKDTVNYPARLPNVISVGAIDKCGIRSGRIDIVPYSCDPWPNNSSAGSCYGYGYGLDVVAP